MKNAQLHLLLAEDDREFFQDALDKIPISVRLSTVQDGEELMQWLAISKKGKLPSLLFLDLNMPRKNGHQCLAEIKLDPDLRSLPVIIFTTAANPPEIAELYKNGAQYYIQKPSSFTQLTQIIEQVLNFNEEKKRVQPAPENFIFPAVKQRFPKSS